MNALSFERPCKAQAQTCRLLRFDFIAFAELGFSSSIVWADILFPALLGRFALVLVGDM